MEIREQIEQYVPYNAQEQQDRIEMLKWIDTGLDLWTRENGFAHWTASAWVVDASHDHVLMAFHNIYQSWAWLGGHADGDRDLLHTAIREVREESGIASVKPAMDSVFSIEILTVDGHVKRGKYVSSHLHLNVTYLLEADMNESVKAKKDENSAVAWFTLQQALQKSDETWFIENIYTKLNQKLSEYDSRSNHIR